MKTVAALDLFLGMNTHPLPKGAKPLAILPGDSPYAWTLMAEWDIDDNGAPKARTSVDFYFQVAMVGSEIQDDMGFLGATRNEAGVLAACYWGN